MAQRTPSIGVLVFFHWFLPRSSEARALQRSLVSRLLIVFFFLASLACVLARRDKSEKHTDTYLD